jgi:hypothetical protein
MVGNIGKEADTALDETNLRDRMTGLSRHFLAHETPVPVHCMNYCIRAGVKSV